MTDAFPVQKFRLGDRVKQKGLPPFIVTWIKVIDDEVAYSSHGNSWYWQSKLTLAPERPAYAPSERLVIGLDDAPRASIGYLNSVCRCETDAELAAQHQRERDHYDLRDDDAEAYRVNEEARRQIDELNATAQDHP